MKDINKYRRRIDEVDKQIVKLLNQRAGYAVEIGKAKDKDGLPVYDPRREAAIFEKLEKVNEILPEKSLRAIYTEVISASRSLETRPVVAYLGPEGTFSNEAATAIFGSSCDFVPVAGFDDVFDQVAKGLADFGVLPIENSIQGSVNLSLDLLAKSDLNVVGEKSITANQNLVSNTEKLEDIKTLYSHNQPLGQCRRFISRYLPGVRISETSSTAEAARKAAKAKNAAALSSKAAARIYGLKVLRRNVQDYANNITRFMVLSRQEAAYKKGGKYKTSLALKLKNRPGSLYALLGVFEQRKINLTKIVSRPLPEEAWSYLFYIDLDGHKDEKKVAEALKLITRRTEELKVLGSYPVEP